MRDDQPLAGIYPGSKNKAGRYPRRVVTSPVARIIVPDCPVTSTVISPDDSTFYYVG
jgi:hypothetical protein